MEIFFILGITAFLAAAPLFIKNGRTLGIFNSLGHLISGAFALQLAYCITSSKQPISIGNIFYVDSLSAFFIFTISILNIASSLYSIQYIYEDAVEGVISAKKLKSYYALFNIFSLSMFFVVMLNNLGMVWVAIEMTTLASAFLVGFHNNKASVEAAWKYIMICSVGIVLALFGTILFYYAVSASCGIRTLNWTAIAANASRLDPQIVKMAFLFILVGYGTKAGIVPMHTWLPDAHSQALSPISALLSGVLLKTAIYAILRFAIIVNKCIGASFTGSLFLFFGILSLAVAAGFILVQRDLKRLLAYSSIEHIGIICFGLGIGAPLAVYGALLHVFNHAVTKSIMFFGAGSIVKKYGTNNMNVIKGVFGVMPFTATAVIIGIFALVGSPPFSIFLSEIIILISAFMKGSYVAFSLFLIFIAVIFGGIIHHLSGIIFGKTPQNMKRAKEPLSAKLAFVFLLVFVCVMGFKIPFVIDKMLLSAVEVIKGL